MRQRPSVTGDGYGFAFGVMKTSAIRWVLHNSANVLNAPELFTFKWLMVHFICESHLTLPSSQNNNLHIVTFQEKCTLKT